MDYLGKKINVTTGLGYQYEGVLTKVDAEESTIELQMVRRTAYNGEPLTDNKVYEYVVFKSDDIVDLYIYQAIADPAIVSEKAMPARSLHTGHNAHSDQSDLGDWLDPQFPSTKQQQQQKREIQFGAAPSNQPISFGSVGFSSAVSGVAPSRPHQHNNQQQHQNQQRQAEPKHAQQPVVVNTETISSKPSSFAAAAAASSHVAPTFTHNTANTTGYSKQQQYQSSQTQKVRSYSTVTKQVNFVDTTPSTNTQYGDTPRPKRREPVIPNSEFDFEQSNQRFDKDQLAAEVAPVIAEVPYYQKSSFFDNISSETKMSEDRSRTERSWNIETFGQPYVRGSNPRGGRGGQRGGQQQRGGHRTIHRNATGSF